MNGRTGYGGLAAALALSRIFAEAACLPGGSAGYGMQRFTVTVLSFLVLGAAYIPLLISLRRSGGSSPVAVIAGRSKLLSGFVGVIFSVLLLFCGAETGLRSHYYAAATVFDAAPSVYFCVLTGAALLFAVHKGLEASTRTAVFVAAGLGVLMLLMFAALLPDIRLNRLYPSLADEPERLLSDTAAEFSQNCELLIFAALCGRVSGKSGRTVPLYLGASCLALLFMTFMYNTVFGRLTDLLSLPFYTLSSVSDITLLHRINGIDAMVWVMAGILRLTLAALAFREVVRECFARGRAADISALVFAAAALALSELFTAHPEYFAAPARLMSSGVPLLAAAVLLPLLSLVCGGKERKA